MLLGVVLFFNHHVLSGNNFNNADIVDAFATPSLPSFSPSPSPSKISKLSNIPRLTPTVSKTIQPSLSPLTVVSQPPQSPGRTPPEPLETQRGQTGSPSPTPSISVTPMLVESQTTPSPSANPDLTPSPLITMTPESTVQNSLISEVQVGGQDAGDEFIELYNPTNVDIDISGWSVQYLTGSSNDITKTVKKNLETGNIIPAHRFFLIVRTKDSSGKDGYTGSIASDLSHRSFSLSGASTGGKIFLVNDAVKIDSLTDANIVDTLDYSFLVPDNGQSLARKDYVGNFELRVNSSPQNTQSQP